MNSQCKYFIFILFSILIQLLSSCTYNNVSREVKENNTSNTDTTNIVCITKTDSLEEIGKDIDPEEMADFLRRYGHFRFNGYNDRDMYNHIKKYGDGIFIDYGELKAEVRVCKKNRRNIDNVIFMYKYAFPNATDSIRKWWYDGSLEKEDDREYL